MLLEKDWVKGRNLWSAPGIYGNLWAKIVKIDCQRMPKTRGPGERCQLVDPLQRLPLPRCACLHPADYGRWVKSGSSWTCLPLWEFCQPPSLTKSKFSRHQVLTHLAPNLRCGIGTTPGMLLHRRFRPQVAVCWPIPWTITFGWAGNGWKYHKTPKKWWWIMVFPASTWHSLAFFGIFPYFSMLIILRAILLSRLRLLVPEPTLLRIVDDGLMLLNRGVPFNGWRWIELHGAGILTGAAWGLTEPPKDDLVKYIRKPSPRRLGRGHPQLFQTKMTVTSVSRMPCK